MSWVLPKQNLIEVLGWASMPLYIWNTLSIGHQQLVLEQWLKRHAMEHHYASC